MVLHAHAWLLVWGKLPLADTNAFENLDSLVLSANEVKELTDWGDAMVEDYLNILRNIIANAINSDQIATEVNQNADDITALDIRVTVNEVDIANLTIRVEDNELAIVALDVRVTQNETDINDHVTSDSQHGVTGVNVGTEDFCTDSVGGVVLLADVITDLTQIATADIAAAPVAYDQTYTQTVADLVNENKAKINEIVLKINAIIDGQQTAKQMGV